jgi:hypothetical protein
MRSRPAVGAAVVTDSGRPLITPDRARWIASYVASLLAIVTQLTRLGVRGGVFSAEFLEQLERVQAAASSVCERVGRPLTAPCPRCGDALGFATPDRQRETLNGWCARCAVLFEVTPLGRTTGPLLDAKAWERIVTQPRGIGPGAPEAPRREAV